MQNPIMHIEMEEGGMIDIELFPDITCNTVRSVIWLADQGLYDGRDFYRVVKDFVLQTDCDLRHGIYETGCDYIIDGEYLNSGYTVKQPSSENIWSEWPDTERTPIFPAALPFLSRQARIITLTAILP